MGAALPLRRRSWPPRALVAVVAVASLVFLAPLGASARAGGAQVGKATLRVTFWGALAMGLTAAVGGCSGPSSETRETGDVS